MVLIGLDDSSFFFFFLMCELFWGTYFAGFFGGGRACRFLPPSLPAAPRRAAAPAEVGCCAAAWRAESGTAEPPPGSAPAASLARASCCHLVRGERYCTLYRQRRVRLSLAMSPRSHRRECGRGRRENRGPKFIYWAACTLTRRRRRPGGIFRDVSNAVDTGCGLGGAAGGRVFGGRRQAVTMTPLSSEGLLRPPSWEWPDCRDISVF